jgi:small subunit ribosomal protein S20
MNKKQRNRKLVTQNNRNRIMNRRYTSTIKTLSKLFVTKLKTTFTGDSNLKTEVFTVVRNLYSIIDKAVKKGVIHKNKAARKKSRVGKLYSQLK